MGESRRILLRRRFMALLPLILAACSSSAADYLPLAVGNSWTYRVQTFDGRSKRVHERVVKRYADNYYFDTGEMVVALPGQGLVNRYGTTILVDSAKRGRSWVDDQMTFEITAAGQPVAVPAGAFRDTLEVTWTTMYPGREIIKPGVRPSLHPGPQPRVFIYLTTYARQIGKIREEYWTIQPDGTKTREFIAELESFHLR